MLDKYDFFTKRQRRIIAQSVTMVAVFGILFCAIVVFSGLRLFLDKFSFVIWPLVIASILALIFRPLIEFLNLRLRLSLNFSICLFYLGILLLFLGLFVFAIDPLIDQIESLIDTLPVMIDKVSMWMKESYPHLHKELGIKSLREYTQNSVKNWAEYSTQLLTSSLVAIVSIKNNVLDSLHGVLGLVLIPIYLYYLLKSKIGFLDKLDEETAFIESGWRRDLFFLMQQFRDIVVSFFRGQLIIATIVASLLAVGLGVIGIEFSLVLGVLIGFLNLIPFLGTSVGLISISLIGKFQDDGSIKLALMGLGYLLLVNLIESYVLTPKIIGKKTGLHPMAIMLSILFWSTAIPGLMGLVLAIPLTAFLVTLWKLVKRRYLNL